MSSWCDHLFINRVVARCCSNPACRVHETGVSLCPGTLIQPYDFLDGAIIYQGNRKATP